MEAQAQRATSFIRTKLEVPVAREIVARAGLVDRLAAPGPRKLTVIRAPAGWGKTTLLAEWLASPQEQRSHAWLSLDDGDNDPIRFWLSVVEALRTVDPELGAFTLALLLAPGVDIVDEVVPTLINELAAAPHDILLALDDYHVIRAPEIHEAAAFLIERLPANVGVALATRTEPPLPLARLRVRRELVELDVAALRFTDAEARSLVNAVHALDLDGTTIERLRERTEGWVAGMYLAILSLRGRSDRRAFIDSFAGNDRHIVDYLGTEVLAEQPAAVRDFLLRTAVLDRFSAPLCEAVTRVPDAAAMLGRIERSNAFLIPLDTRRQWYRYHHLFGELLRHELALTEPPEAIAALHARAAAWLDEAGFASEAIHHAIAAGDVARASELIGVLWLPATSCGQRSTVVKWLEALPEHAVLADARLCLVSAWSAFSDGCLDDMGRWCDAAERAELPGPFWDLTTSVASGVANARASYLLHSGDVGQTMEVGREAMRLERTPNWRAVATTCVGTAAFLLDRSDEAAAALEETVRLAHDDNPLTIIWVCGYLAELAADRGDWAEAARLVDVTLELIDECRAGEYWLTVPIHCARGRLLTQQGRFSEAEAEFERCLSLTRRVPTPILVACMHLGLGDLRNARGDRDGALRAIAEATSAISATADAGVRVPRLVQEAAQRLRVRTEPAAPVSLGPDALTERERAVLRLLPSQLSQREIGAELFVSRNTVKTHMKSIFAKLQVGSREDAVERARRLGLL